MSVQSKLDRLSLDLHKTGLSSSKPSKPTGSVADSWEDDASDNSTEADTKSPSSEHSVAVEAPGPTHLKSPTTKAIDAERELNDDLDLRNTPDVPPPTPISPQMMGVKPNWSPAQLLSGGRPGHNSQATSIPSSVSSPRSTPPILTSTPSPRYGTPDAERKRPEKTTATANRLIAGALGIRTPPKTEEQRKYDRAVREAEIKKRNKEREQREREKEEDEKAKNSVWET